MFDRDRGTECLLVTSDMMRVDVQHHLVVRSEIRPRGAGNELNADCRSLNSSLWNWALYTLAVTQQNKSRPVWRGIISEAASHVKHSLPWEPSLPWHLETSRKHWDGRVDVCQRMTFTSLYQFPQTLCTKILMYAWSCFAIYWLVNVKCISKCILVLISYTPPDHTLTTSTQSNQQLSLGIPDDSIEFYQIDSNKKVIYQCRHMMNILNG